MVTCLHRFACRDGRTARAVSTQRWPAPGRQPPRCGAADSAAGGLEAHRVNFLPK